MSSGPAGPTRWRNDPEARRRLHLSFEGRGHHRQRRREIGGDVCLSVSDSVSPLPAGRGDTTSRGTVRTLTLTLSRRARGLHGDQRGSISIVSVFAVMFLAMLLGMVMNVGRHVDGKLRMQNAADSAAYSGGVVLARGMNTLAFTNHLLCDVFAVTAVLREARDENSASYAPADPRRLEQSGQVFSSSGFPKFTALGSAIQQKVPLEQQMVDSYSAWAKSVSDQVLPMMEEILSQELIPQYQRAVMVAFPDIAQAAAQQTAPGTATPTTAAARCSACCGGPTPGRWAATPNRATRPTTAPCRRRSGTRLGGEPARYVERRSPSGGSWRTCTSTSGTPS